jgi:hypothetical protein
MDYSGSRESTMSRWFHTDERTEAMSGRLAVIFLGLTQIAMYLAIMIQRYVLERPPNSYNDLTIILAISTLGYWGLSLYLGSILPALSLRSALIAYAFLVLAIAIPHTIVHGWPSAPDWVMRTLVYLGLPVILVAGYGLLAYLGKKRSEKLLESSLE